MKQHAPNILILKNDIIDLKEISSLSRSQHKVLLKSGYQIPLEKKEYQYVEQRYLKFTQHKDAIFLSQETFNEIGDLLPYLEQHPDQKMIENHCFRFLNVQDC